MPYLLYIQLSEGQYSEPVGLEMSALRAGCQLYDPHYHPQFAYVVGTKRHLKKFFEIKNNSVENLTPGESFPSNCLCIPIQAPP